jgi:hypothetical protein
MPRGIGSWRRRENSGRLVGSKLREEGRAESQSNSEWRVKWPKSGDVDRSEATAQTICQAGNLLVRRLQNIDPNQMLTGLAQTA